MKTKNKALLAGPFLVWTVAFIAIPLLMVIYYGFTGDDGSFTLENVKRILAPHYLKSLWLALLLSLVSTVACLVMSYPLAMILSKLSHHNHADNSIDGNIFRLLFYGRLDLVSEIAHIAKVSGGRNP